MCLGPFRDRKQDPPDPEVQGPGPRPTRGHVLPDQEGRLHQEASGEEQEGQGRQVPSYPGRVQDPPSGQVRLRFLPRSKIIWVFLHQSCRKPGMLESGIPASLDICRQFSYIW